MIDWYLIFLYCLIPFVVVSYPFLYKWKHLNDLIIADLIVMFMLITYSLTETPQPHYLLGITPVQKIIMIDVFVSYVFELTGYVRDILSGVKNLDHEYELMHTIPGAIGIMYILYVKQFGGIIVRLLLDSITYLIDMIQEYYPDSNFIEFLRIFSFIVARSIYYSVMLLYSIYVMIMHWEFVDKLLFVMFCIWTVYFLYDHIYIGFWLKYRFQMANFIQKHCCQKNTEERGIVHNEINDNFIQKQNAKEKKD
ncbi:hypothetical protein EIN_046630 [Entamoeba invadens IP1]|uniref:Uncharacterized protein n=1 Tax=Entamoeba invadens IP1 TaxID=370355 RepID=A0A0A1UH16_ENTIV|nr:hypothetical protein EIN_046630 [Entamoeba invadens IP1]ELP94410.1 hypothetical protein EIN_046630 [Entamoeba invadens IP1]|eukprot:XP_004261181.1 hypothetical protein EIN_046630 [Entamoeba invadens IP1]